MYTFPQLAERRRYGGRKDLFLTGIVGSEALVFQTSLGNLVASLEPIGEISS